MICNSYLNILVNVKPIKQRFKSYIELTIIQNDEFI